MATNGVNYDFEQEQTSQVPQLERLIKSVANNKVEQNCRANKTKRTNFLPPSQYGAQHILGEKGFLIFDGLIGVAGFS